MAADWAEKIRARERISPRQKTALRLWASGAVNTKGEAAKIAGLAPSTFYVTSSPMAQGPLVKSMIEEIDKGINSRTIELSAVVAALSRKALGVVEMLMDGASSEGVRLKAAQDVMDRNPELSKVQRHQVESITLTGQDAQALALALVEASESSHHDHRATEGDFITVQDPT